MGHRLQEIWRSSTIFQVLDVLASPPALEFHIVSPLGDAVRIVQPNSLSQDTFGRQEVPPAKVMGGARIHHIFHRIFAQVQKSQESQEEMSPIVTLHF